MGQSRPLPPRHDMRREGRKNLGNFVCSCPRCLVSTGERRHQRVPCGGHSLRRVGTTHCAFRGWTALWHGANNRAQCPIPQKLMGGPFDRPCRSIQPNVAVRGRIRGHADRCVTSRTSGPGVANGRLSRRLSFASGSSGRKRSASCRRLPSRLSRCVFVFSPSRCPVSPWPRARARWMPPRRCHSPCRSAPVRRGDSPGRRKATAAMTIPHPLHPLRLRSGSIRAATTCCAWERTPSGCRRAQSATPA